MPQRSGFNEFGLNVPCADRDATIEILGIAASDRVLEVGGGGNPFPRANVVCDLTFGSSSQRNGAPAAFRSDVAYVEAPCESLPFADGEFDFVYCTQVLEHVRDPQAACAELARVARRGFVETPSRLGELVNGNPTHRWIVDASEGTLVFSPRPFVEHPLRNFFYGVLFARPELRELSEGAYRNLFNVQRIFEGSLPCRIAKAAAPAFDYDDPAQAARAHLDFARRTLEGGAPPSYGYPDALEAVRALPGSRSARLLLAAYELRLLRFDAARDALAGLDGAEARALGALADLGERGLIRDFGAVPAAAAEPGLPAPAARPLVSILVAGGAEQEILAAAESALAQDYPRVEVLAAAPGFGPAWDRLRMGDRLRRVPVRPDASLGEALNLLAAQARGSCLAFCIGGDRLFLHHADLLLARLSLARAGAAIAGFLDPADGSVGLPDPDPARPAALALPLSCVLAEREFLLRVGGMDEREEDRTAESSFLRRVLEAGGAVAVGEATVHSSRPPPEGSVLLRGARAAARLDSLALLREVMALHTRLSARQGPAAPEGGGQGLDPLPAGPG